MADDDTIYIQTDALDSLLKTFREALPNVRVGVLGTSGRSDGLTNAEVGAAHEFGTSTVPRRSFLRMPVSEKLSDAVESSGAFDEDVLNEVLRTRSIKAWMTKVGALAVSVVLDAFATGGFGTWLPWSRNYSNKTGNILVDTQQLRNSITYDVR